MIRFTIESEKELKPSSIEKVKQILTTSTQIEEDLKETFPKGFTSLEVPRFVINFGNKRVYKRYLDVEGIQDFSLSSTKPEEADY